MRTNYNETSADSYSTTTRAAYYRGAQGIILVYDVSQRETFDSLDEIWLREVEMYATVPDAIKMVVANKTDLVCGVPGQGPKSYPILIWWLIFGGLWAQLSDAMTSASRVCAVA